MAKLLPCCPGQPCPLAHRAPPVCLWHPLPLKTKEARDLCLRPSRAKTTHEYLSRCAASRPQEQNSPRSQGPPAARWDAPRPHMGPSPDGQLPLPAVCPVHRAQAPGRPLFCRTAGKQAPVNPKLQNIKGLGSKHELQETWVLWSLVLSGVFSFTL